jgi:hypothetical protein
MDGRKGRRRERKREGTGKVEGKVSPMLAHPSEKFWRHHCSPDEDSVTVKLQRD